MRIMTVSTAWHAKTPACLQNLGSLEQVALEIDGGGGLLSPGYGSGGGFGSGSLTTIV